MLFSVRMRVASLFGVWPSLPVGKRLGGSEKRQRETNNQCVLILSAVFHGANDRNKARPKRFFFLLHTLSPSVERLTKW